MDFYAWTCELRDCMEFDKVHRHNTKPRFLKIIKEILKMSKTLPWSLALGFQPPISKIPFSEKIKMYFLKNQGKT